MKRKEILFGKYRLIRKAGSGQAGTVWKAVHLGLEEYRAIKQVPKEQVDYEGFRREALILKELRHPGIPMVYDLEEDTSNFYLIEEYLEGNSLYSLITEQGAFREKDAVQYGMQICSLVEYLHDSCNEPILHLDLQPNNLIIWNQTVRLIDFNHSAVRNQANLNKRRYGTKGWAAPELYTTDRLLDQRTDIYAIGGLLRFMVCGTLSQEPEPDADVSEQLQQIIRKCMSPDMDSRYTSVKELGEALSPLISGGEGTVKKKKTISSLEIIVAGSRPGAGATHLAFGLCAYLTRQGISVLYEEKNRSGAIRTLCAKKGGVRFDQRGISRIYGCFLKPWYGPGARLLPEDGFQVILKDYGMDWNGAAFELKKDNALLAAVICENLWEDGRAETMIRQMGILEQEIYKGVLIWRGKGFRLGSIPSFRTPEYENPFSPSDKADSFLRELWREISTRGFKKETGKFWNIIRRIKWKSV